VLASSLLRLPDWLDLAEQLAATGKEVVLSSQTLIESESDLKTLRRSWATAASCRGQRMGRGTAAVRSARAFRRRLHAQRLQPRDARRARRLGARRWLPPVEMSRASLASLLERAPAGMETEVFAYGKLPLAYSARCFTRATSTCRRTTASSAALISRRTAAGHPRRRALPHAQRHPDAVRRRLQPDRRTARPARTRRR